MIALPVSALLTGLMLAVSVPVLRRGLLDLPNHRSSHTIPIPRGGGISVIAGILLAVCGVGVVEGASVPWSVLLPAMVLAGVGLADDLLVLGGVLRLVLQVAVAAVMVVWIWWPAQGDRLPWWTLLLVAIACAGYTNAFNFMDGINGISAFNAGVVGAWFTWLGYHHGLGDVLTLGAALCGATLAFIPANVPTARVFLGDVGSYGLGMLIAGVSVLAYVSGVPFLLCVAPLVIYVAETGVVVVRRALGRRPLMEAHREHVYQRLVDRGWAHVHTAALTGLLAVAMSGLAWLGVDGRTMTQIGVGLASMALLAVYLALPAMLDRRSGVTR